MATVTIAYYVPDEKAKGFVDAMLDTASTNAEYILYEMEITNKKHISVPVEYSWTYDDSNQIDGTGSGNMEICGDGVFCECD